MMSAAHKTARAAPFVLVESAPRGYRLKASNAASPISYFNIDRDIPLVCGDATNDRRTGY
jgi:hypothetical protein